MTHEEERNYCPRCGKRLGKNDWDVHTCTPPQPERHELQAKGEHPAPCARHCEANAFQIVIKNLKAQLAQRKPLTDEEIINKCLESGFERNCLGWSFTYGKLDYHLLKLARAIEAAHNIKENKHDATTE